MTFLLALTFAFADPVSKELPAVKEPDWNTWKDSSEKDKATARKAWGTLCHYRPEHEYKTLAEQRKAEKEVDQAYDALEKVPNACFEIGAELVHQTKDDWERIMIASYLFSGEKDKDKQKSKPFLLWSMAQSKTIDHTFDALFPTACSIASEHKVDDLPALFLYLRTHDGTIELPRHRWTINTNDCLYYVFGRFGPDVIPYLRPMLKHQDPYVRRNAAILFGYFMDRTALPELKKMLESKDIDAGGAAYALGEFGDKGSIPEMVKQLKNPDSNTRFLTAYALYEMGSKEALPALKEALEAEKKNAANKGKEKENENETKKVELELQAAIEHLESDRKPFPADAKVLTADELKAAILEARKGNGLTGQFESIAASAGEKELAQLEEIRQLSMTILSDRGNKWFRNWTNCIKAIKQKNPSS